MEIDTQPELDGDSGSDSGGLSSERNRQLSPTMKPSDPS